MAPSMSADLILEDVTRRLARRFGRPRRERRARIMTFGSSLTCSLNYSKLLHGDKYFFGLPPVILDPTALFPQTKFGEFVPFEELEEKISHLKSLSLGAGARVTGLVRGERFEVPEHLLYPEDV